LMSTPAIKIKIWVCNFINLLRSYSLLLIDCFALTERDGLILWQMVIMAFGTCGSGQPPHGK